MGHIPEQMDVGTEAYINGAGHRLEQGVGDAIIATLGCVSKGFFSGGQLYNIAGMIMDRNLDIAHRIRTRGGQGAGDLSGGPSA